MCPNVALVNVWYACAQRIYARNFVAFATFFKQNCRIFGCIYLSYAKVWLHQIALSWPDNVLTPTPEDLVPSTSAWRHVLENLGFFAAFSSEIDGFFASFTSCMSKQLIEFETAPNWRSRESITFGVHAREKVWDFSLHFQAKLKDVFFSFACLVGPSKNSNMKSKAPKPRARKFEGFATMFQAKVHDFWFRSRFSRRDHMRWVYIDVRSVFHVFGLFPVEET